jgi:ribulose-phosphate 3-epimerase
MSVRIAPSILSADLSKLADEIAMLEEGGADWIHVDVMDGRFVPNLTFGAKIIESVRKLTKLPLDVHLMVVEPENYFDDFAAAGANGMSIHTEVSPHLQRQLNRIRELGCRAGAVVNPATPLTAVREVLADMDLLLVMTVNPGFGGQKFIKASLDVRRARMMLSENGLHRISRSRRKESPEDDSLRSDGSGHIRRRQRHLPPRSAGGNRSCASAVRHKHDGRHSSPLPPWC